VPAYLYLPSNRREGERRPAMLALHPTDPLGKAVVDGAGPLPSPYGKELAQRGYVVLAPDYPSFGDYPYDFKSGRYASGTMKGILNHIRGVDLLRSRPEVDPKRLAVTGASSGGTQTLMICAADPRVAVAVPVVMVSTAMQGGCVCENCELLRVGAGNVDFAALFAPKPLAAIGAKPHQ